MVATTNCTITVEGGGPPTLTLSANPQTINTNSASTLNWFSTNATSCTASGGWSGAKAVSGSQPTGNLSATTNYTLGCSGSGGSVTKNATVSVSAPPTQRTVTLTANPGSITAGQSTTLNWSSTNATSCTASGGWSGARSISGSASTGRLNQTTDFTLTCSGSSGFGSASFRVIVNQPTPASISITVQPPPTPPTPRTVQAGQGANYQLKVCANNLPANSARTIDLSFRQRPPASANIGADFNPRSVTVTSGQPCATSILGVTTAANTPAANYTFNIEGNGSALTPGNAGIALEVKSSNRPPVAEAGISLDGATFSSKVIVNAGKEVELWLSADKSDDPDGWVNPSLGVASGGKCEWNTDLAPAFVAKDVVSNPATPGACNRGPLTKTFATAGTFTIPVLRITDRPGAQSNIATISVEVKDPYPASLRRTIRGHVYYQYANVRIAAPRIGVQLFRGDVVVDAKFTDMDGFFQFNDLQKEQYKIVAIAPGFAFPGAIVDLRNSSGKIGDLSLTPAQDTSPYALVKVLYKNTPVAAASVKITWKNANGSDENNDSETNNEGKAFFFPVDEKNALKVPANVNIEVSAQGFKDKNVTATISSSPQEITVQLEYSDVNSRITRVRFLDRSTRKPVLQVSGDIDYEGIGSDHYYSATFGVATFVLPADTANVTISANAPGYQSLQSIKIGTRRDQTAYMTRSGCKDVQGVKFCFSGEKAEKYRDNDGVLNTIAREVVRIRTSARLPQTVPDSVLIGDYIGDNTYWIDPVLSIGSDKIDKYPHQWLVYTIDHEMGHAVFAKSPTITVDQIQTFSKAYTEEIGDEKMFKEETESTYGIDYLGHPEDNESETFASITALIAQMHNAFHQHLDFLNDRQKAITKIKHDIVHQVTGL